MQLFICQQRIFGLPFSIISRAQLKDWPVWWVSERATGRDGWMMNEWRDEWMMNKWGDEWMSQGMDEWWVSGGMSVYKTFKIAHIYIYIILSGYKLSNELIMRWFKMAKF